MNNVFLVTRPIQYINVLNLPVKIEGDILLLVNSFEGWKDICELAENDHKRWKKVVCLSTHKEVIRWILKNRKDTTNFYTYSDNGISWHVLFFVLRKIKFHVYEEGWATYSHYPRNLIKIVLSLNLNAGTFLGGSRFVKSIYIYNRWLHKALFPGNRKTLIEFRKPMIQFLLETPFSDKFVYSGIDEFKGKNVLLYITNWNYNIIIDQILLEYDDFIKVIKPHPRYKRNNSNDSKFDHIIDGQYIAEIIIAQLISHANKLVIVHECSTAMLYFAHQSNVIEINLRAQLSDTEEYMRIRKAIENSNQS